MPNLYRGRNSDIETDIAEKGMPLNALFLALFYDKNSDDELQALIFNSEI